MFTIANSVPRCSLHNSRLQAHARLLAKYVLKTEFYTNPCYVYVIKGRTVLDNQKVFHKGDVIVARQAVRALEGAYSAYEFNSAPK